jgi:hypothetical protein
LEDHRASRQSFDTIKDDPSVERAGLDAVMRAGAVLAARVLAGKP